MRVEVRDLHRAFGDNSVLRGLSLEIPQHQITLVVGTSGCGKSVLLKHLIGLLKPDRGEVIIDGQDITPIPERRLAPIRRRFGLVFQSSALLGSPDQPASRKRSLIVSRTSASHRFRCSGVLMMMDSKFRR